MTTARKINAPPYHVQSTAEQLRDGFPYFPFHDSVSALWAQKWRPACVGNFYPLYEGDVADFDPIFAALVEASGDDPAILLRPDDYASHFLPVGERLVVQADEALAAGRTDEARALFLRAGAVYRIARFPINRSPLTQEAWARGKAAFVQTGALLNPPSVPVHIDFPHADPVAGDHDVPIEAYLRVPGGDRPATGWPLVLFVCGLDSCKTDNLSRTQIHADRGYATLIFEIPGTGDCPAAPNDPLSPDRLMSSVLDWVAANAAQHGFDLAKVIARGISTGGYYAFRLAHTHADQLFAVTAEGGGAHHLFDPDWIGAQDRMEYPFALAEVLAHKFGYRSGDYAADVARYMAEAGKFSLVTTGVLDRPSCRLLVMNGTEDSIFPMEDSVIVGTSGHKKDLVLRGDHGHMGAPGEERLVYDWIDDAVTGKP